ncbi:MAG: hypothetical protein ACXVPU_12575, partial [Bacteroidia bacterium]
MKLNRLHKLILFLFLFFSNLSIFTAQNSAVEYYQSAIINDQQKDYTAALESNAHANDELNQTENSLSGVAKENPQLTGTQPA